MSECGMGSSIGVGRVYGVAPSGARPDEWAAGQRRVSTTMRDTPVLNTGGLGPLDIDPCSGLGPGQPRLGGHRRCAALSASDHVGMFAIVCHATRAGYVGCVGDDEFGRVVLHRREPLDNTVLAVVPGSAIHVMRSDVRLTCVT